ncbi:unnamed protein product, partial [marine sediment metagenome]
MAVEIHEDQPLVEPAAAGLRRAWIPIVLYDYGNMVPSNPARVFRGEAASASYRIPTDFTSIDSLEFIGYGHTTRDYTITTRMYFGQCG